jgi:hypothetical protein
MYSINNKNIRGFTLLYSLVVIGLVLTVGSSMFSIMIKELKLAQFWRESQIAYYSAESGVECALYWGISGDIFPDGGIFSCNDDSENNNSWDTSDPAVCSVGPPFACAFTITFCETLGAEYCPCAYVTVNPSGSDTVVESRGYNTCAANFPRRVERGVRATY